MAVVVAAEAVVDVGVAATETAPEDTAEAVVVTERIGEVL